MADKNIPEDSFHDFDLEKFIAETLGFKLADGQSLGIKTKPISEFFYLDQLEEELSLPQDFFNELLDENDWSFVIKLHALIEAAVTHLLMLRFNEPKLDSIFSFLQLNNPRTGKLAFAKAAGLIDTETERYIQRLSQLRNAFVHDVVNVNNNIKDFLDACDMNQKTEYRKGFLFGYQDGQKIQLKVDKNLYNSIAIIQSVSVALYRFVPKLSIWFGAIIVLSSFYEKGVHARDQSQMNKINKMMEELFRRTPSSFGEPEIEENLEE